MSEQAAQVASRQPEEGIEPDDLDTKTIVAVGLISTALLLASVLGVTALVDQFQRAQTDTKVYQASSSVSYGSAEAVLSEQRNKLNGYAKSTAEPGVYAIPIDEAKKLVLSELRAAREAAGDSE